MNINKLNENAKNELLSKLIDRLDELDEDDFFGTEGWQKYFGLEDF